MVLYVFAVPEKSQVISSQAPDTDVTASTSVAPTPSSLNLTTVPTGAAV